MLDINPSLKTLQEKLQLLIKHVNALEKENQQLKNTLVNHKEQQSNLELQLKQSQADLTAAMVSKGSMNEEEKQKWVKKIDQYIKEIDHSINNLNP
jgi:chromosome segregation ATPase